MFKLTRNEQKLVILLVCLLGLGIVLRFVLPAGGEGSPEIILHSEMEKNDEDAEISEEKELIIIHITGAVQEPGVYILEEGAEYMKPLKKLEDNPMMLISR